MAATSARASLTALFLLLGSRKVAGGSDKNSIFTRPPRETRFARLKQFAFATRVLACKEITCELFFLLATDISYSRIPRSNPAPPFPILASRRHRSACVHSRCFLTHTFKGSWNDSSFRSVLPRRYSRRPLVSNPSSRLIDDYSRSRGCDPQLSPMQVGHHTVKTALLKETKKSASGCPTSRHTSHNPRALLARPEPDGKFIVSSPPR